MKIKISDIAQEGLTCSQIYEPQKLDLETEEIKFRKVLQADYQIRKEGEDLFVNVVVKALLEISCVRCLENFEYRLQQDNAFHYKVKETDTIDTTEDLRQEIILNYPIKPLCKPDCLGLCPKCGENLNKGKCNCKNN